VTAVGLRDRYRASLHHLAVAAFDGQVTVAEIDRRLDELMRLYLLSVQLPEPHSGC
jgi:hypothetical protein